MTVTLEARTPCLMCGYQHHVVWVVSVRVNKASLRSLSGGVGSLGYHHCPECGTGNAGEMIPVSPYRLAPSDARQVTAYRARKWPVAA